MPATMRTGNLVVALFMRYSHHEHGGSGGGYNPLPHNVFLSFFLEDKTSVPDAFTSCSFIPRSHFETSLVMVSCYGYEK